MIGIQDAPDAGRIESAASVEPKCSGRRAFNSSIPPTFATAYHASTIEPPIAMMNWMKSVTTTPHRPLSTEYAMVMRNIATNAWNGSMPSTTPRILIMARLTHPMMIRLIGSAMYSARKTRSPAAALPL